MDRLKKFYATHPNIEVVDQSPNNRQRRYLKCHPFVTREYAAACNDVIRMRTIKTMINEAFAGFDVDSIQDFCDFIDSVPAHDREASHGLDMIDAIQYSILRLPRRVKNA